MTAGRFQISPQTAAEGPRIVAGRLGTPTGGLRTASPHSCFVHKNSDRFLRRSHPLPRPDSRSIRRRPNTLHRTLTHVDPHPKPWDTRIALVRHVGKVRDDVATLEAAAVAQGEGNATGLTKDRQDARDLAEARLGALGAAVGAYAIESGDDHFRVATDISRSEWDEMADADFFRLAEVALARIEAALPDLNDYDVTAQDVADAREAVEAARPLRAERDTHAAGRTSATKDLGTTYATIVPSLRVLDRLVPRLVKDDAFVKQYRIVRRVTDD